MKVHSFAAHFPSDILSPFIYETKKLKEYEILVKITHSGLCLTDLYMMKNDWNRSNYPLVPGHEVVGIVIKKGKNAEKEVGERVALSWVRSSCLTCKECKDGDTNICPTKVSLYGSGHFGGFADYIVADSRFSYKVPKILSSSMAAPLLCAGATVFTPLSKRKKGESVAVIGIGGLGHLGLQFSKKMGFETSAISSKNEKEQECKKFGADHFYTFKSCPRPMTFDFILCTSDAALDHNEILNWLRPNGTLCFVSRPPSGIHIDPMNLVSTQRAVVGSNNANREDMKRMLTFAAENDVHPQVEEMKLSQINEGIKKLESGKVRYRIVFTL